MASLQVANRFKYEMGLGTINMSSDSFKVALMDVSFTFDRDNHGIWADVSSHDIATTGGYTAGGSVLTTETAWAQDNGNDRAFMEWANETFTATGANMETFSAAVLYNDTHANDVILGCITFDTAIAVTDGNNFQLQDMGYDET